ncbi:hypothetical protein [Longimicrobium sp.]|uniref:hypothetical protein n=1 Tax=Longimicrobium sp. TaxID=2029185 RepID=UPI002D0FF471|nr:hypothetical protein [Longimicrobium sp.]HSU17361.1 hypothetical protein [Longimicrobium sp.]
MPTDTQFYPSVSTLLPLERIPQNLGFIQGALQDVFGNLYYRDLQVQKSAKGDVGFYQLTLVVYKRLAFEIPGTGGAALVLQPAATGPNTEIDIALGYRWEVLKYVRGFSAASLGEMPRLLFDAFVEISGATSLAMLAELIDRFHGNATDPVKEFVDAYNVDNVPAVPLNVPPTGDLEALLVELEEVQEVTVFELLIAAYLDQAGSVEDVLSGLSGFFGKWVKEITLDDFEAMLIPHCSVALRNLKLALEFPRTLLKPVNPDGTIKVSSPPLPEDQEVKSRLTFTAGSLLYSTDAGLQFDALGSFSFDRSQIGDTGIIIGFSNMKLDLSRTTNIPEATADGRPVDFVGVYVQNATIDLPAKWFKPPAPGPPAPPPGPKIVGSDIIIGTGGFSGKIGFDAPGVLHTKLGNIEAGLTGFDLTFERNAIKESNIAGWLKVPGFKDSTGAADAVIDIKAHLGQHGDFEVTASVKKGVVVSIPGVMDFKILTLKFGREDRRCFLETSGTVTLTLQIPALSFDRPIAVELKKLVIWEDGKFEIEGGTIILPQALSLKIGPVKLSVTAISMGSYERGGRPYKYFGFDGGVSVNPGGVDCRANGVKVYYSTDDLKLDVFMRVEGIAIDIVIPGGKSADEATVLIGGFLQVKEPADPNSGAGTEYAGGISFKLPKAGIGGSAAMRLNPSIPAFIIDTELSISVPIPLGNTSLGIYGFRGMIGMRYVATRAAISPPLTEDASWYEYYKARVPLSYKEGINIDKFAQRKGFAIGAGLTIGTLTDSGKAFSAKLFLLLSLPDAFLLQGQAAIVSERVDLSPNDPPFSVLIAVTKQSVEAAFGVFYKLPDTGEILDLQALIEMGFYFNDSSAWYVNVGRDQPESKRVTARLFKLFNAWSYLMLSGQGIRAGAGVTWDFSKGFGPVQVAAHAYLDTQGRISFKQPHIGAAILLGGSAAVRVFKFRLGFSVAAGLAAEAPEPFIVTGSVDVEVDLPKPFKKYGGTFTLDFTWTFSSKLDRVAVPVFNQDDVSEAARAVNLATRERFALNVAAGNAIWSALPPAPDAGWSGSFKHHVVPLDCSVDIEFKKPIAPSAAVTNIGITGTGYANTELVPPQPGKSPQVRHTYGVDEVRIRSWNEDAQRWDDYDVYAALTPLRHTALVDPADLAGLKQGWWQMDQPGRVNKLSLLSQTPLAYANDVAGPFAPENSGVTAETLFCPATPIADRCVVFDAFPELRTLEADRRYTLDGVQVRVKGKGGRVIPSINPFGLVRGAALEPGSMLEIFFPEATGRVSLRMASQADSVTVLFQRRVQTGVNPSTQPVYAYVTVRQDVLNPVSLLRRVAYDDAQAAVDKVVVVAGECACLEGVTGAAAAQGGDRPTWPDDRQPPRPPAPPCGSMEAWLATVCADARARRDALREQRERLLAQAAENALLAADARRDHGERGEERADSARAAGYEAAAEALNTSAAAVQAEIDGLNTIVRACPGGMGAAVNDAGRVDDPAAGRGGVEAHQVGPPRGADRCLTLVFGVCWLPLGDQLFNQGIPSLATLQASNQAMVAAINRVIPPIWRPDTIYAVSIATLDRVAADGYADVADMQYMHVGFRTDGPVGHFHEHRAEYDALAAQDRADQYRLQSLKPYIDFAHSYPNPDGNVLGAKPLFFVAPRLRLFYLHPYVYTMYGGTFDAYNGNLAVTSTLEASILDPVDPVPKPGDPGDVGPVSVSYVAAPFGRSGADVKMLNNLATRGDPCTGVGKTGIAPGGVQSEITVERLKPLKLYLAVFKARFKAAVSEVHRYNFQTSRYADFAAQVNSYRLHDADGVFLKDAVFDDLPVTLDAGRSAQLAGLLAHPPLSDPPLEQEYADPFDRLVDGILRLGPLDPPTGTDVNVVRNAGDGRVIGILLRNPEPFNDPRVPAADVAATIVLSQPGTAAGDFTTLHSRDRSRAFVAHAGMDLQLHDLSFTFTYLEYDGAAYVPASTVKASFFPTPPAAPSSTSGTTPSTGLLAGVTE